MWLFGRQSYKLLNTRETNKLFPISWLWSLSWEEVTLLNLINLVATAADMAWESDRLPAGPCTAHRGSEDWVSLSSAMRTILLCLQPAEGRGSRECKAHDPEATTERQATATPVGWWHLSSHLTHEMAAERHTWDNFQRARNCIRYVSSCRCC